MPPDLYFFFSYARENRRNAVRQRADGSPFNLLDQFCERLCQSLSDVTGVNAQRVGYRDISSLNVGVPWPQELAQAMQISQVLIALFSPHYLLSMNCGREFHVFLRRHELLKSRTNQKFSFPALSYRSSGRIVTIVGHMPQYRPHLRVCRSDVRDRRSPSVVMDAVERVPVREARQPNHSAL